MNRSENTPCRNSEASSEEMKELFTDPSLKALESDTKPIPCSCSCHNGTSNPKALLQNSTSSEFKVQVEEPAVLANGGNLMTRRITIAGGFLDIALFSANCEQLKFVLELGEFHIYYNEVLGLIITSLLLQILVGFTMFLLGCQVTNKNSDTYLNILNHITMGLVALITIVNIFISTFGPKGTVMARCLGAFAYPNTSGPFWNSYLNFTRFYMMED